MLGTDHIHCDKRAKGAPSASWNRTSPIEGLIWGGRTNRLGERFGDPFTELEAKNLKVGAVLDNSGSL